MFPYLSFYTLHYFSKGEAISRGENAQQLS